MEQVGAMDQEKPFKTIEVIDSKTTQRCKVACMSCIRGHRTTSCGIPVCRSKIFWTVKRPGRPSNTCNCRYGATGGCKCVVARSACPHKSKKGEKRTGECRCDEQGRYCCLLEPAHWTALLSLQNPIVGFFPTREQLATHQAASVHPSFPPTPAYSSMTSPPPSTNSVPGTPSGRTQPVSIMPSTYYSPQPTTLTPRFGMMGIGAPMGSQNDPPPDVLAWEGEAPQAPRPFRSVFEQDLPRDTVESCCEKSTLAMHSIDLPISTIEHTFQQPGALTDLSELHPCDGISPIHMNLSHPLTPQVPPAFDWQRLQTDYFNYQLPSAICQNCGLNGCTCKNCPPPFQNYGTGSWAQCCGRKHARDTQPSPEPIKMSRTEHYDSSQGIVSHRQAEALSSCCSSATRTPLQHQQQQQPLSPFPSDNDIFPQPYQDLALPPGSSEDFASFGLDHDLLSVDGTEPLDMSEFLISDFEPSNNEGTTTDEGPEGNDGGGCCCDGT